MGRIKKDTKGKRDDKENAKLKRKFFNYCEEDVRSALKAIRDGTRISTASKIYKVPRTTLRNKLSGRAPETSGRVGREAVLGRDIEERLAQWLLQTSKMGFPVNKDSLSYSVKKLLETEHLPNPFIDNLPGRKWFEAFLRRHPRVTQKKAEHLSKARSILTEKRIRLWFADIRDQLGEKVEILQDPRRVFNMDETAVYLSPKGSLVLAEKGKSVYDVITNGKENITTLFTVNAAGEFAPPLTVFKYTRLPRACIESAPVNWGIGKTENGWMTNESFYEYFANVFHPFLVESEIPLPVVVFLDGHVSHLSLQLSVFCKERQIEICCFPSHATHILQPLDVAVFFPLKQKWKTLVRNWRNGHDGEDLQKHQVPSLLSRVINEHDFTATIKNGFKTCGLYPFDDNAVNYTKCVKEKEQPDGDNVQSKRAEADRSHVTHRDYVESKIDPELLRRFEEKRAINETWDADDRNAALYELWLKIIDDEKQESVKLGALDASSQSISIEASELTIVEEIAIQNVLEIPFPDFASSNISSSEHPEFMQLDYPEEYSDIPVIPKSNDTGSKNSYTLVQNETSDNGENFLTNEKISNQMPQIENANTASIQVSTDPLPGMNVVTESVSPNIVVREKSMDEILDTILLWPKKQTTKSKKSRQDQPNEHTPSVITSNKWIEIMQAKEKAKNDEEQRKRIKKEERVARMELNKKIKVEKLEERRRKKASNAETKFNKKRK